MEDLTPLVTDMPDVQENAINALEIEEQKDQPDTLKDKLNRLFDKDIHSTKPDGSPKLNNKGLLTIKRKPSVSSIGGLNEQSTTEPEPEAEPDPQAIKNAAIIASETFFLTGQLPMVFGEEGAPTNDERSYIQSSFEAYFKAKGVTDVPSGVMLSLALISYAAPRFTLPKVKTRFGKVWSFIKSKVGRK